MNIVVSKLKSKKPPKFTTTFEKVKYFEKLAQYVVSNAMPSHIAMIHRNMKLFGKKNYTPKGEQGTAEFGTSTVLKQTN